MGLSDKDTMRGLIPMHVQEAERTNKASQGRLVLVFPLKGFWISKKNVLAPTLFYVCIFLCCDKVHYGTFWKASIL